MADVKSKAELQKESDAGLKLLLKNKELSAIIKFKPNPFDKGVYSVFTLNEKHSKKLIRFLLKN